MFQTETAAQIKSTVHSNTTSFEVLASEKEVWHSSWNDAVFMRDGFTVRETLSVAQDS